MSIFPSIIYIESNRRPTIGLVPLSLSTGILLPKSIRYCEAIASCTEKKNIQLLGLNSIAPMLVRSKETTKNIMGNDATDAEDIPGIVDKITTC